MEGGSYQILLFLTLSLVKIYVKRPGISFIKNFDEVSQFCRFTVQCTYAKLGCPMSSASTFTNTCA